MAPAAKSAAKPAKGDPSGSARRQLVSIIQEVTRATRVRYDARDGAGSHLQFGQYQSASDLLAGTAQSGLAVARSLSDWNEGTPSLRDVSDTSATVGFHYLDTTLSPAADRNARGVLTDFPGIAPAWGSVTIDAPLNEAVKALQPTAHHIGDRDIVQFQGYPFRLVEAQTRRDHWSSWRVYLYDETAAARGDSSRALTKLSVKTHKASSSFGNPTATVVTDPGGSRALVVTLFVFSEGAAAGEAGALIYYKRY